MNRDRSDAITFAGLQGYLTQIGFDQPVRLERSVTLHHRESGTLVVLSIPPDGLTVRPADLLSLATRLENQGLVDDASLALFKAGQLPLAS